MALIDQVAAGAQGAPDDGQDPSTMSAQDRVEYYRRQRALARGVDPDVGETDPTAGTTPDAPGDAGDVAADTMADTPAQTPAPAAPIAPGAASTSSSYTTRTSGPSNSQRAYLAQPPSDSEVRSVLQQIKSAKRTIVSPADQSSINDAEAEARQLYHDKADRAEWMSVAEKLGNAMIKFGQANAAIHHNVDVSQMKDLAPTDWDKKIDRASEDYKTDLGSLEKKRQNQRQSTLDAQKVADDQYEDQVKGLDRDAAFQQYKYGQESSDYRRNLQDESRENRQMNMEQWKEGNANRRAGSTEDKQLRNLQASDYQKQYAAAQEQEKAAKAAANLISQSDTSDPKVAQKLEEQSPGLMGKAGITPADLAQIDKASQVPGRFYGTNTDPDARNKAIQEQVLAPIQKKELTLRQVMDHLYKTGGASTGQAPAQDAVPTQTPAPRTVTPQQLQDYAAAHFSGNIDKAHDFLSGQGYTFGTR